MLRLFKPTAILILLLLAASPAPAEQSLTIPGTGDSQSVLRKLARAFEKGRPATSIEIPESIGSSGGIRAVSGDKALLARAARQLKPKETALGLSSRIFGYSPVVFAANLESPCIEGLTSEEAFGIFSGAIDDWSQLASCPEGKIYVAHREEGDSSLKAIEKKVPGFDRIDEPAGKTLYSTPEMLQTLERYRNTLGYIPLSMVAGSEARVLGLDGVLPTADSVQDGSYPLVTPFSLVWKKVPAGAAKEFVDFIFGAEGREILLQNGVFPPR